MPDHSIKHWHEDERPREKLLQKGAAALTDAELLAILIGSGVKNSSALDVARDILALAQYQLQELGRLSVTELKKIKGIGAARAITIAAALELGRRRQTGAVAPKEQFNQSQQLAHWLRPQMQDLRHEIMMVIFLNNALQIIKHDIISQGGLDATVVDIRMILKQALLNNATRMVLAHNHPSGQRVPSPADKQLTRKLTEAALMMDIKLLDHIIIAGHEYFSFADEGLI